MITLLNSRSGELKHAKNPVFIIGDEACDAIESILTLVVETGSDLIVTPQGKGLVSPITLSLKGYLVLLVTVQPAMFWPVPRST